LFALLNSTTYNTVEITNQDKKKRHQLYQDGADIFVFNHEKFRLNIDGKALIKLVTGKRVMVCLDEVHEINSSSTQKRKGLEAVLHSCAVSYIRGFSATTVNGDPENYRAIFDFCAQNPLGTLREFRDKFSCGTDSFTFKVRLKRPFYSHGQRITSIDKEKITYQYDDNDLKKVPNLLTDYVSVVRKSDDEIKDRFVPLHHEVVFLDMSETDKSVYDMIKYLAFHVTEFKEQTNIVKFNALRYTCLGLDAHLNTSNPFSQFLVEKGIHLSLKSSSKFKRLLEDIYKTIAKNQKIVVFTHYTNLSLIPLSMALTENGIKHLDYYGELSDFQRETVKEKFRNDDSIHVLLCSDAGSHGMNLEFVHTCINYDVLYSHDQLIQRINRIHRVTSSFDSMQSYIYVYRDTMETRMLAACEARRMKSEAVQGTDESISFGTDSLDTTCYTGNEADWQLISSFIRS
jgi:hypothetical protein